MRPPVLELKYILSIHQSLHLLRRRKSVIQKTWSIIQSTLKFLGPTSTEKSCGEDRSARVCSEADSKSGIHSSARWRFNRDWTQTQTDYLNLGSLRSPLNLWPQCSR